MTKQPLLDCQKITKVFGGLCAVDQANLQIHEGEILGLVGPNGSGKTTLINLISGQTMPSAGRILFDGKDVTRSRPHQLAHAGIARTYQIPQPFSSATVLDNVALSWMFGRHSYRRTLARERAHQTLTFVGLDEKAMQPVSKLNLHERKFLELARALALEPKLLLLDEVLAGLNPAEVDLGMELIRRIHEQRITLLVVEHNVRVVTDLSHRMVVMNYGRNIAAGLPMMVIHEPHVVAAYLGDDYAAG
ncbi:ABC transporter ATP-binding protein [Chloroflexi bacterium TSY]|nr:ABC transporter ATP-binding protein [Chloroflexi bacterium TSY]